MTELTLVKTRLKAGIWEGVLRTALGTGEAPEIAVTHLDKPVTSVAVAPLPDQPGHWTVRIAISPDVLSDGVQTFVIWDPVTETRLESFCIIAGDPLDDDVRSELDLLRAELDMLKKAFRRHCAETA